MSYAEVAVNAAAPLRQTFTYHVPEGLPVTPGQAVYVPFGTRTLQGVVMEVTEEAAFPEAREIEALIDPKPLLSPAHVALARWLSDHYLAPLFDCISLMLPPGFKRRPLAILRPLASLEELPRLALTDKQGRALTYIIEHGEVELEELRRVLRLTNAPTVVGALLRRGFVQRSYQLARPQVRPKMVPHLRLLVAADEARALAARLRQEGSPRALRRAMVLEALAEEGSLPLARLRVQGLTPALLRDLQAERLAVLEDVTVIRDPLAGRVYPYRQPTELTADQEAAYHAIAAALETAGRDRSSPTFLLHGVTGSGKTEVYLAALERALALGKRAIALVPEISLTPQTVRRFGERFPDQVAVMHSGLSLGEHFDMWHEVRDGRYAVVIGPRGALFAPQPDLGLVIIDEEHEWTYKQQEGSPRYHARRAAEELCRLMGAVLVLGSATPDVESHFRAQEGSYRLLELPQRLQRTEEGSVTPSPLPEVEVVDLRSELKAGNLNRKYDVVILPDDGLEALTGEGRDQDEDEGPSYPPEYRSGFGDAGVKALQDFVKAGGTLITFAGAGDLPIERFGLSVRNVVADLPGREFWSPGSTLRVRVDTGHPLAFGMPDEALAVFLAGGQVYETTPSAASERTDRLVTYVDRDLLESGWLLGEDHIAGKAAVLSVKHGDGRVVLLGFRAQHRAQTHGTFKLLFNALVSAP